MTIQDQLDDLRRDLGDFSVHQDLSHPPAELINGDYPVAFRQHQLGVAMDDCVTRVNAMQEVVSSFDARLKALEAVPVASQSSDPAPLPAPGSLSGVVPIISSSGDAGLQLTAGQVTHRLYGGSADYGLRMWFNYREPYVNGSSYSIPSIAQMYMAMEKDGAISFGYFKPQSTPAGPYDNLGGKGLLVRAGGWNDEGKRDRNVSVYTGQVGRGLQFGACRSNPNYPDRFDLEIDPTSDSPVSITVEGQKRRVRMRPDGTLYAE